MNTIKTAKEHFIEALESLDKSKMSLNDLMMYAQVLKVTADIQTTDCTDMLAQTLSGLTHTLNAADSASELNEIKEAANNGM